MHPTGMHSCLFSKLSERRTLKRENHVGLKLKWEEILFHSIFATNERSCGRLVFSVMSLCSGGPHLTTACGAIGQAMGHQLPQDM